MSEQPIQKYSTLRAIAGLLTFLGTLLAIAGGIAIAIGIVIGLEGRSVGFLAAIIGGAALPISIFMLASGEGLHVQLDTEANTRQAAESAAMMLADLGDMRAMLGQIAASTQRTATAVEALAATVRR